jgi:hypothetical protein
MSHRTASPPAVSLAINVYGYNAHKWNWIPSVSQNREPSQIQEAVWSNETFGAAFLHPAVLHVGDYLLRHHSPIPAIEGEYFFEQHISYSCFIWAFPLKAPSRNPSV